MKKKKVIIICVSIIFIGIIIWLLIWNNSPLYLLIGDRSDNELTASEEIAELITVTKPTDIIIIGDKVDFEEDVTYRHINEVTEAVLVSEDEYLYTILVVNDVYNNTSLSEDEQEIIDEAIKRENFCLIYMGEKYSTRWENEDTLAYSIEGNIHYTYFTIDNERQKRVGALNISNLPDLEKYQYMLGEALLHCFSSYLKNVN